MNSRICRICGKEFTPKSSTRSICYDDHYKVCEICGETYKLNPKEKVINQLSRKTCYKKECIAKQKQSKIIYTKICVICGKEFKTNQYNRTYCYDKHYRICEICGEKFEIKEDGKLSNGLVRTYCYKDSCCKKHLRNKRQDTWNNKSQKEISEIVKKQNKTWEEKYGYKFAMQNPECKQKMLDTCNKKYGGTGNGSLTIRKSIVKTNLQKYSVPYYCMTEDCKNLQGHIISNLNKSFSELLKQNKINNELEFKIGNYCYDIHIINTNILIEINPTYTHNSTLSPLYFRKRNLCPIDYHYNKTKFAKQNGYRCIHIFDWDDKEKIINMLTPKEKIFARKCKIREITKQEANMFLNTYHLQNKCNGNSVNLGLYYNDELIQIMTFGKPRYNKNYEYELLRFCTKFQYKVTGGSEKLFKYFIDNYSPRSIISYCDNSKFNGEVYNKLGFKLKDYGGPSKHWVTKRGNNHITDNLLRQQGFDRLLGDKFGVFGKGTNNEELMIEHGFVEVYDCGQSVYVWPSNL